MTKTREPVLIVAERGQVWLAALRTAVRRRSAPRPNFQWVHVQGDAAAELARAPAACLVLETSRQSAARDLLQLAQWRESYPGTCLLVAVRREDWPVHSEITAAFLEVGAAAVLTSPRQLDGIVPVLLRHWQHIKTTTQGNLYGRTSAD